MKRPQNMTMRELIALPILDGRDPLPVDAPDADAPRYGGAFRDEDGYVWGTLRTSRGWARYPAHLSLLRMHSEAARAVR